MTGTLTNRPCGKCGGPRVLYSTSYGPRFKCRPCKSLDERKYLASLDEEKILRKKEKWVASRKEWERRNKESLLARQTVRTEVRAGRLVPLPCLFCGDSRSQAHHEDYSKPLDVVWLCRLHHVARHNEIRDQKRALAASRRVGTHPTPAPRFQASDADTCASPTSSSRKIRLGAEFSVTSELGALFRRPPRGRSNIVRGSRSAATRQCGAAGLSREATQPFRSHLNE